ncbi:MAG: hypothetical protein QF432_02265 [Dehalococcoidales bacterium]|jgi:hypothetical protein|nr:hypothetical protein [Dehalococcoidales bacterium]|tara:strand:+ start:83 stop:460 length:378 start_codon:yes stop_codon:yes gene_type:complete
MPSSEEIVGFLRSQNAVKEGESPWPTVSPEERRNRVNHNEIFPARTPERDTPGSDTPGDEWQPTFPDRKSISLGGDSDTMACITGGIAEAYYKSIPDHILESVKELLNSELLEIIEKFEDKYGVL